MKNKEQASSSLPIACPNEKCREVGWIPINRLDRQLVCRVCGTKFYMDGMGAGMEVGERPKEFRDPFYIAPPTRYRPNLIERTEKWYVGLSKRTRTIVKSVAATPLVVLAIFWVYVMYLKPAPKLPNGKDLNGRAIYVVKAFTNDKPESIAMVTDAASFGDIKSWIKKTRPVTWPRVIKLPKATVRVVSQSTKSGKATVLVEIEDPAASSIVAPPPVAPPPTEAEKKGSAADEDEKGKTPTTPPEGADVASAETGAEAIKAPATTPDSSGEPGVETPPSTKGADPEATAETPKPEPPKKLKFNLYFIYKGEEWRLDLATTLRNAH